MKASHLAACVCAGLFFTAMAGQADATTVDITFAGAGVSGAFLLTYGTATDTKYSTAYEVTGVSGIFTDTNKSLNYVNAPLTSLLAVTHATPDTGNSLAPNDFSRFAVGSGLPSYSNGFVTYDNLFWPGGSPQTASDYVPHGGFLDIYGLMFALGNGTYLNLFSNGVTAGTTPDYGVALVTASTALDYVSGGVSAYVPEPGSFWLFASGLLGLAAWRRRAAPALRTLRRS